MLALPAPIEQARVPAPPSDRPSTRQGPEIDFFVGVDTVVIGADLYLAWYAEDRLCLREH